MTTAATTIILFCIENHKVIQEYVFQNLISIIIIIIKKKMLNVILIFIKFIW